MVDRPANEGDNLAMTERLTVPQFRALSAAVSNYEVGLWNNEHEKSERELLNRAWEKVKKELMPTRAAFEAHDKK